MLQTGFFKLSTYALSSHSLTKFNLRIKTSPTFSLFLFAYSYRLFKTFNRAPLKYSLEALCLFPGGRYARAALETV